MIRPHRRDGYKHRIRVHVRMDPEAHERVRELASSLHMSVSHFMDLLAGIATEEGGDWLRGCLDRRVQEGIERARDKFE